MIRKLRFKITLLAVLLLGIVLILVNIAHGIVTELNFKATSDKTLLYIVRREESHAAESESSDTFSDKNAWDDRVDYISGFGYGAKITAETAYEARYFSVSYDAAGNIVKTDLSHIAEVTEPEAERIAGLVTKTDNRSGTKYNFRYLVTESEDGSKDIYFLNRTAAMRSLFFSRFTVATVSAVLVAVTALIVWASSKRMVAPFTENMNAQKQFITNAGHEIKTPISIIAANTEVLKMIQGENQWLDSIEHQTSRLSRLVSSLVTLSKADEGSHDTKVFEKFSISDALIDTVSVFSALADRNNVKLEADIEPDVIMSGDEASIRQLCEILIENAVKYCLKDGYIYISLKTRVKSIHLDVTNDCVPPDKKKLDRLFDRFYRADDSRSRDTGGYGIGLSIAKAITENHKGKITSAASDNSITFSVVF